MTASTVTEPTRSGRRLTPRDLVREPFTIPDFERPEYDPATQASIPADPLRMLWTHCMTTQTVDSGGRPYDGDGQQSDD